jgi:hypothetical protein
VTPSIFSGFSKKSSTLLGACDDVQPWGGSRLCWIFLKDEKVFSAIVHRRMLIRGSYNPSGTTSC